MRVGGSPCPKTGAAHLHGHLGIVAYKVRAIKKVDCMLSFY